MIRKDKPFGRKIETLEHPNGMKADLRFEQSSLMFEVRVGDDVKKSRDGAELKTWARAMMGKAARIDWIPVIEAKRTTGNQYYSRKSEERDEVEVGLELDRYYVGQTPGGQLRKLEWKKGDADSAFVLDAEDRFDASEPFDFTSRGYRAVEAKFSTIKLPVVNGNLHYLPFTTELWDGLLAMVASIREQSKLLEHLLTTKAGLARVRELGASGGKLLLTSGSK